MHVSKCGTWEEAFTKLFSVSLISSFLCGLVNNAFSLFLSLSLHSNNVIAVTITTIIIVFAGPHLVMPNDGLMEAAAAAPLLLLLLPGKLVVSLGSEIGNKNRGVIS